MPSPTIIPCKIEDLQGQADQYEKQFNTLIAQVNAMKGAKQAVEAVIQMLTQQAATEAAKATSAPANEADSKSI